jgi:hypothetical protein
MPDPDYTDERSPDTIEATIDAGGKALVKLTATPTIPATVDGFAVRIGLGPYPPDAPGSHRRAMYAELTPVDERPRKFLESINRERLLGICPLTVEGALDIELEPDSRLAEAVAREALGVAVRELRKHGFAAPIRG